MLHYPTRPKRVEFLRTIGIEAISLDSLKDDAERRIIENLQAVAWNGIQVAFEVLKNTYPSPGLEHPARSPMHVMVLGSGGVASHVIQAATRYGNEKYHSKLAAKSCPGVIVTVVDYDITNQPSLMEHLFRSTDILVDATQRKDPCKIIVPNEWIAYLPVHAVILDLSVDPYDFSFDPPEIKGIEGIPNGNLDQYIFNPDDPAYEFIPQQVQRNHRRKVVSCYSWPGIYPRECMEHYGDQLRPVIQTLIERGGIQNISPEGTFFERAIARAQLTRFKSQE
jgi:alanine dehydrogenase